MAGLPDGTVTFLFTDIEGSTQLLERVPAAYGESLVCHDAILRGAVSAHDGVVFETVGDAIYAAFRQPSDAVASALAAQLALRREPWGETGELRVRMGIHTGEVERRGDHYFGRALYRCARLMAIGYGGQVLLSSITASLVRDTLPPGGSLRSLGTHRLKDLGDPEEPHQLVHTELISEFPALKSLNARPNNLPVEVSTFIGRDRELSELRQLLDARRVVTITGPGGTGKTRMAMQVAAEAIDSFADGAFFVPLASVSDSRLVVAEIARNLGVSEVPGQPLAERLGQYLAPKHMLLVLDNFEQVIAAAQAVADLLAGSSGVKVLITSRAPLRISGEQEFPAPPLALPNPRDLPSLERLAQFDGIRLFIERAAQARPDFALSDANAPAIAKICDRLDGLPLAIELAAARVKLLDLETLRARLDRRLPLLVGGRRDAPARQQTLRGAISWSHDLLDQPERELFRRLAVFAGGFTLEAAESVCRSDGSADVLGGISTLVDNSLIRRDEAVAERFAMLATIREYALEQLGLDPGASELHRRHAEHFLGLVERAPGTTLADRLAWFALLEHERENIRGAIEWAAHSEEAEIGLRLATAATTLWVRHGHWTEGITLLQLILAVPIAGGATRERAAALRAICRLAIGMGDLFEARRTAEESIRIWRVLGDAQGLVDALNALSEIHGYGGDYVDATAAAEEAIALARGSTNEGIGHLLHNLGLFTAFAGDLERGRALLEEALREAGSAVTVFAIGELDRMSGDYDRSAELGEEALDRLRTQRSEFFIAPALATLGLTTVLRGDIGRGAKLCIEGLEIARRLEHQMALALGLDVMAIVEVAQGQDEHAARLFGAADALRAKTGMAVWEGVRLHADRARERARGRLGEAAFRVASAAGRSMPVTSAIDGACRVNPPSTGAE